VLERTDLIADPDGLIDESQDRAPQQQRQQSDDVEVKIEVETKEAVDQPTGRPSASSSVPVNALPTVELGRANPKSARDESPSKHRADNLLQVNPVGLAKKDGTPSTPSPAGSHSHQVGTKEGDDVLAKANNQAKLRVASHAAGHGTAKPQAEKKLEGVRKSVGRSKGTSQPNIPSSVNRGHQQKFSPSTTKAGTKEWVEARLSTYDERKVQRDEYNAYVASTVEAEPRGEGQTRDLKRKELNKFRQRVEKWKRKQLKQCMANTPVHVEQLRRFQREADAQSALSEIYRIQEEKKKIIEAQAASSRAFICYAAKKVETITPWIDRELRRLESKLPILAKREELYQFLHQTTVRDSRGQPMSQRVLIVKGATGSGKSTQIPQYVADYISLNSEAFPQARRRVVCIQPRPVAAPTYDLDESKSPKDVCMQDVRDRLDGSLAPIYTSGELFLSQLQAACKGEKDALSYMQSIACAIIDEVHERSVTYDILLGCFKLGCFKLDSRFDFLQGIRIIVSSATINVHAFSEYFAGAQILEIPGRTYPIQVHFYKDIPNYTKISATDLAQIVAKKAIELHQAAPWDPQCTHDILCFLPTHESVSEAVECCRSLLKNSSEVAGPPARLLAFTEQSNEEVKELILSPRISQPQRMERRIIFATSVAETSLTIDGVTRVIDSGLYHPALKVKALVTEMVSQASATQRAGRAGRTHPGECHRLYSEETFRRMQADATPEVLVCSAWKTALTLAKMSLDPEHFPWMDGPSQESIREAKSELTRLDALTENLRVTELGRFIESLGVDPACGRILFSAKDLARKLSRAIALVSMLDFLGSFHSLEQEKTFRDRTADRVKKDGEIVVAYRIFYDWLQVKLGRQPSHFLLPLDSTHEQEPLAAWENHFSVRRLTMVRIEDSMRKTRRQLEDMGHRASEELDDPPEDELQRMFLVGYFTNLCRKATLAPRRTMYCFAVLSNQMIVCPEIASDWLVFYAPSRDRMLATGCSPVSPKMLTKEVVPKLEMDLQTLENSVRPAHIEVSLLDYLKVLFPDAFQKLHYYQRKYNVRLMFDFTDHKVHLFGTDEQVTQAQARILKDLEVKKKADAKRSLVVPYTGCVRVMIGPGMRIQRVLFPDEFVTATCRISSQCKWTEADLTRYLDRILKSNTNDPTKSFYEVREFAMEVPQDALGERPSTAPWARAVLAFDSPETGKRIVEHFRDQKGVLGVKLEPDYASEVESDRVAPRIFSTWLRITWSLQPSTGEAHVYFADEQSLLQSISAWDALKKTLGSSSITYQAKWNRATKIYILKLSQVPAVVDETALEQAMEMLGICAIGCRIKRLITGDDGDDADSPKFNVRKRLEPVLKRFNCVHHKITSDSKTGIAQLDVTCSNEMSEEELLKDAKVCLKSSRACQQSVRVKQMHRLQLRMHARLALFTFASDFVELRTWAKKQKISFRYKVDSKGNHALDKSEFVTFTFETEKKLLLDVLNDRINEFCTTQPFVPEKEMKTAEDEITGSSGGSASCSWMHYLNLLFSKCGKDFLRRVEATWNMAWDGDEPPQVVTDTQEVEKQDKIASRLNYARIGAEDDPLPDDMDSSDFEELQIGSVNTGDPVAFLPGAQLSDECKGDIAPSSRNTKGGLSVWYERESSTITLTGSRRALNWARERIVEFLRQRTECICEFIWLNTSVLKSTGRLEQAKQDLKPIFQRLNIQDHIFDKSKLWVLANPRDIMNLRQALAKLGLVERAPPEEVLLARLPKKEDVCAVCSRAMRVLSAVGTRTGFATECVFARQRGPPECNHLVCDACVTEQLTSRKYICPCEHKGDQEFPYPIQTIRSLLGDDWKSHLEYSVMEYLAQNANQFGRCVKGCNQIYRINTTNPFRKCDVCNVAYCTSCTKEFGDSEVIKQHPGLSCEEMCALLKLQEEIRHSVIALKAPCCGTPYVPSQGSCNVRCPRCQHQFCAFCLDFYGVVETWNHVEKCPKNPAPGFMNSTQTKLNKLHKPLRTRLLEELFDKHQLGPAQCEYLLQFHRAELVQTCGIKLEDILKKRRRRDAKTNGKKDYKAGTHSSIALPVSPALASPPDNQ